MEQELQQLKRELESVKEEAGRLRDEVDRINTYGSQISTNLDIRSQDSFRSEFTPEFRRQLREEIFDVTWDSQFYYFNAFDSVEGWYVQLPGATVNTAGLNLFTNQDTTGAGKMLPFGGRTSPLSYDHPSRFRTMLALTVDTTIAGLTYSLAIGANWGMFMNSPHYGFRVEGNVIYGTTGNGTASSKVAVGSIDSAQGNGLEVLPRNVEARFYPQDRVEFYLSDILDDELKLVGTLKTTLPSGSIDTWINFYLNSTSGPKGAYVNTVEYIQKK